MFDIGLMEILLILIIALLVIGPERMPEVARKIGQFMGKTKKFINTMKEDSELSNTVREIKASINLEEERKQLQDISHDLNNNLSSVSEDLNLDEFQRPFGGQNTPSTSQTSQFNKAPSQPIAPKVETPAAPTAEMAELKPATETTSSSTVSSPATPEPIPTAESTAKTTQTTSAT